MTDASTEPWHLKREVNVSHLMTTIMMAVSLFWWASSVEKRLSVVEALGVQQAKVLEERLNRIEDKLDRIIQREIDGRRAKAKDD